MHFQLLIQLKGSFSYLNRKLVSLGLMYCIIQKPKNMR